jgi:hypothetical protein
MNRLHTVRSRLLTAAMERMTTNHIRGNHPFLKDPYDSSISLTVAYHEKVLKR